MAEARTHDLTVHNARNRQEVNEESWPVKELRKRLCRPKDWIEQPLLMLALTEILIYPYVFCAAQKTTDYEVRGLASGCWCAFFSFAFLSVLFADPLCGESVPTFNSYSN
jgi:hypothetical protein